MATSLVHHDPSPDRDPRPSTSSLAELRWLASSFENAQAQRVRTGEQLRAVLQGRDPKWLGEARVFDDPDRILAAVRVGDDTGPVPLLGQAYQRYWNEERQLLKTMSDAVMKHPAWPWLSRIKGVGPSLAARLLARLDVERAPTPSSFWAYCGLATVEGVALRCEVCGNVQIVPSGRRVPTSHLAPETKQRCSGPLTAEAGTGGYVRVAQPRPVRGESAPYDLRAKQLCYLVGVSFLRQGDSYKRYYDDQRSRLDGRKEGWAARRKHLTALRMTEKLFLCHLWLVWREALHLPVTQPYAADRMDGVAWREPWRMVDR
jgi:hypothetical protein